MSEGVQNGERIPLHPTQCTDALTVSGLLLGVEHGFEVACAQRRHHIQISVEHIEQGVRITAHAVVQNAAVGAAAFIMGIPPCPEGVPAHGAHLSDATVGFINHVIPRNDKGVGVGEMPMQ